MSTETDYLIDDNPINNQTWACVSFITPELVKGCESRFINIRGVYGVKERAEDRCKELHKIDSTYGVYVIEVGKWIAWLDDQKSKLDANNELNRLMKVYKKERSNANIVYEKRKNRMKSSKEISDLLEPVEENKDEESINESNNEHVVEQTGKEIKYLKEDDPIHNQKYYCISFLTPEQLEDQSHDFKVRGFKVRGMFEKDEDAKGRCKKLYETDQNNNIFIADIGHWVSWSNDTENVKDIEYANKDLNKLIKATNENQEKARMHIEQEKNNLMKDSLQNMKIDNKVDGIVNEIIDESFEEDITLSQIEKMQSTDSSDSNEEDLDDVTRELENAKKLYDKMLKEQKK
jgi:hypothetical protein